MKAPRNQFFRVFSFCKPENVEYYISHYGEIQDRDGWLEKATRCDWKTRHYFVREQFENGSWTPRVTEGHEVHDLLSDEIHEIRDT